MYNFRDVRFFEQLIPFLKSPQGVTSWKEWDFDNFKFIVQELFLYCTSSFLKQECFDRVNYLVEQRYYVEESPRTGSTLMRKFTIFRTNLRALEHRNKRLNLRRLSLQADLLNERSSATGLSFTEIMQADFILYVRDCLDSLKRGESQGWWPDTLLYTSFGHEAFEVFARSESSRYFDKLKVALGIQSKDGIDALILAYKEKKLHIPQWEFDSFDPPSLLNYELLCTRP